MESRTGNVSDTIDEFDCKLANGNGLINHSFAKNHSKGLTVNCYAKTNEKNHIQVRK